MSWLPPGYEVAVWHYEGFGYSLVVFPSGRPQHEHALLGVPSGSLAAEFLELCSRAWALHTTGTQFTTWDKALKPARRGHP